MHSEAYLWCRAEPLSGLSSGARAGSAGDITFTAGEFVGILTLRIVGGASASPNMAGSLRDDTIAPAIPAASTTPIHVRRFPSDMAPYDFGTAPTLLTNLAPLFTVCGYGVVWHPLDRLPMTAGHPATPRLLRLSSLRGRAAINRTDLGAPDARRYFAKSQC